MKTIIFGASGMIGKGVLLECLDDPSVSQVTSIGRGKLDINNQKLKQIVHGDFTEFDSLRDELIGYDACFYCLGVSAAGMNEKQYTKITHDYAMAAALVLFRLNPNATFIYVSGQGTDSSEKGRSMWARVKGKLENDLLALGYKQAFMFRPGMIIPKQGIQSRTPSYRFMYRYFMWLIRIVAALSPNSVTDTVRMGRAMINAHQKGYHNTILTPKDINELAISK